MNNNKTTSKVPQPKPATIGTEKISAKCGHPIMFDLYAKDPFRDGRRQKALSRDCPTCRQARVAADAATAAARKAEKKVGKKVVLLSSLKPRLPDGAHFQATYTAAVMEWTGSLTIEGASFELRASSLKQLLHRLDDAYRSSLPTAAADTATPSTSC